MYKISSFFSVSCNTVPKLALNLALTRVFSVVILKASLSYHLGFVLVFYHLTNWSQGFA